MSRKLTARQRKVATTTFNEIDFTIKLINQQPSKVVWLVPLRPGHAETKLFDCVLYISKNCSSTVVSPLKQPSDHM